jgi:hypothetical protein
MHSAVRGRTSETRRQASHTRTFCAGPLLPKGGRSAFCSPTKAPKIRLRDIGHTNTVRMSRHENLSVVPRHLSSRAVIADHPTALPAVMATRALPRRPELGAAIGDRTGMCFLIWLPAAASDLAHRVTRRSGLQATVLERLMSAERGHGGPTGLDRRHTGRTGAVGSGPGMRF